MITEITYQWRIKWAGRWTKTRYHCTVAQIQIEHPEAVRFDDTRREMLTPGDPEEVAEIAKANSTSAFRR